MYATGRRLEYEGEVSWTEIARKVRTLPGLDKPEGLTVSSLGRNPDSFPSSDGMRIIEPLALTVEISPSGVPQDLPNELNPFAAGISLLSA